jgi:prophage regulatory protein
MCTYNAITMFNQKPFRRDLNMALPSKKPSYLRIKNLKEDLGISESTIWRLIKKGDFPKPVKLSANCTAFKSDEVDAWKASRGAA